MTPTHRSSRKEVNIPYRTFRLKPPTNQLKVSLDLESRREMMGHEKKHPHWIKSGTQVIKTPHMHPKS